MDETILKSLAEAISKQTSVLEQMEERLSSKELDTKTAATVHTATRLHGSGGLFAGPLERDVITAHIRPQGIVEVLPVMPSTSEDPRYGTVTGFTDVTGSEPTHACEDAPSGYIKGCNLTSRFGLIRRDTNTIEMDKVMLKLNRGDFTDLVLRGKLLGLDEMNPGGMNVGQVLDVITMAEMVTASVQIERKLTKQIWQGVRTIANEFAGLDALIATGQKDADTGIVCPALDSYVADYNYQLASSTLVTQLSAMEWYLNYNAERMGLAPVEWVVVMRPDAWFEITSIWPCAYNTTRCSNGVNANASVTLDGRDMTMERDAMRNGLYILINGRKYRVIVDSGIFEKNSTNNARLLPGEFASSIYFVPLTIVGNMPVTYREYVDYRQATPDVSMMKGLEQFFWTDNGMYSWAVEQILWCYKFAAKTEQRVILRAPQLAGRLDNVKYSPVAHLRDSDPSSSYFKDGGVSVRAGIATPYAVWTTR